MIRNTHTGLDFENRVRVNQQGLDLSKHNLYKYLQEKNIDWSSILSRKLLPDEAYLYDNKLYVYEKKYQQVEGSADEKPQTCGFKLFEFSKIAKALALDDVYYIYIFNDWFRQDKYTDMLSYIKSIPGCDYVFEEEINNAK